MKFKPPTKQNHHQHTRILNGCKMHIIGNNPILRFITIAPFDRGKTEPLSTSQTILATPLCNEAESSNYTSTEHSNPRRSRTISTLRYKNAYKNAHTWQQPNLKNTTIAPFHRKKLNLFTNPQPSLPSPNSAKRSHQNTLRHSIQTPNEVEPSSAHSDTNNKKSM